MANEGSSAIQIKVASELIWKLADWEIGHLFADDAMRVGETPVDTAIRFMNRAQNELAEAKKMSKAFGRGEVAAYHEASVLREQLAEANRKLAEREWVKVEDRLPPYSDTELYWTWRSGYTGLNEDKNGPDVNTMQNQSMWYTIKVHGFGITHWKPASPPTEQLAAEEEDLVVARSLILEARAYMPYGEWQKRVDEFLKGAK